MEYIVTVKIPVTADTADEAAGAAYRTIAHGHGNGVDWKVSHADGSLFRWDEDHINVRLG